MLYKHQYRYHQLLALIFICLLTLHLVQCQGCTNSTGNSKPTRLPLLQTPNQFFSANKLDEKIVAGIQDADLKEAIKDIQEGKQINLSRPDYMMTSLITLAVKETSNQISILKYLLSYYQNSTEDLKQKINQKDSFAALRVAINTDQPEVVQLLLEHHADPYYGMNSNKHLSAVALAILNPSKEMVKYPNLNIVKLLVKHDNCNLPCTPHGMTPLQSAMCLNTINIDRDTIEYLLNIGANPFVSYGSKKHPESLMSEVMKSGRLDIISLFFEKGKVNYSTVLDTYNVSLDKIIEQPPLHIAVQQYSLYPDDEESKKKFRSIIEYLIGKGAEKSKIDQQGNQPTFYTTDPEIKALLQP